MVIFISYEIFYNINKASVLDELNSNQRPGISVQTCFLQGSLGCITSFRLSKTKARNKKRNMIIRWGRRLISKVNFTICERKIKMCII